MYYVHFFSTSLAKKYKRSDHAVLRILRRARVRQVVYRESYTGSIVRYFSLTTQVWIAHLAGLLPLMHGLQVSYDDESRDKNDDDDDALTQLTGVNRQPVRALWYVEWNLLHQSPRCEGALLAFPRQARCNKVLVTSQVHDAGDNLLWW